MSIGEQLKDALNDPRKLGTIYKGLTNYILAKNGGSCTLLRLIKKTSLYSFTSHTLYHFKYDGKTHLKVLINCHFSTKSTLIYTTLPHIHQQTINI